MCSLGAVRVCSDARFAQSCVLCVQTHTMSSMLRLSAVARTARPALSLAQPTAVRALASPADSEPTFAQCVGIYFDQAAKYTKWPPGLLQELRECKAVLDFKCVFAGVTVQCVCRYDLLSAFQDRHLG